MPWSTMTEGAGPKSKAKAVTRKIETGVKYAVFVGERCIWKKFVKFGKKKAHRSGGAAFQMAAREQQVTLDRYGKEGSNG